MKSTTLILSGTLLLLSIGTASSQVPLWPPQPTWQQPQRAPPWDPYARRCVAEYEQHYRTMGDWIYYAAACTARTYPATQNRPNIDIELCVNKVRRATWNIAMLAKPDRIDAVMNCLGAR